MCQHYENQQHQGCNCGETGCDCGEGCCGSGNHFQRRYQTKAEQIADLESYLSELKQEVQAVEERLADLRK
ncbi:MAG: hypothetical protein A2W35_16705 [Chloroflexi bacterium RBG_16_57_11]|nr:MAG: hypothetical protein A2W35_16705 [Chloroflexi bacterium RBG_16_57_11]